MPDMKNYISHEHGWANLDQTNKTDGHYQRRPAWLTQAADKLRELEKREIETIDDWEDGNLDYESVRVIRLEREQAQVEFDRLYEFWNAQPVHLEGIEAHAANLAEIPQEITK